MATSYQNKKAKEAARTTEDSKRQSILKKQGNGVADNSRELHFADDVEFATGSESVNVIDDITVVGYRRNHFHYILTWVFYVLTIGLLRLVFFWRPDW